MTRHILSLSVAIGTIGLTTPPVFADEVILKDGGRLRGTVIEESPTTGVQLKLLNGKFKVVDVDDLKAVRYDESTRFEESKRKSEEDEEESDEVVAEPPRRPKRRRLATHEAEETAERPRVPEKEVEGARKMVTAGGVLTALGWAGTIAGAALVAIGTTKSGGSGKSEYIGAGLAPLLLCPGIGIAGSAILGIGVQQRRELREKYDMAAGNEFDPSLWKNPPQHAAAGVTFTLQFR